MRTIVGLVVCGAIALGACSTDDNTPQCVPKQPAACFCATGDPGQRICHADGLGYGDCECLPDAGPTADAASLLPHGSAGDSTSQLGDPLRW